MTPFFKKKIISFIVFGLAVLGLVFVLIVCPLISKIAESSQKYRLNCEVLESFNKKESLARELKKNFQQQQDSLSKIDGILLASKETVGFISTLEAIAEETNNILEIKTVSPSDSSIEAEPFLSLRATIRGDFAGLLHFIAKIEDSPYPPYRLIEIVNLNIRRLTGSNISYLESELEEGDLESNIEIKIYIR